MVGPASQSDSVGLLGTAFVAAGVPLVFGR
jgi:hypothetical protein